MATERPATVSDARPAGERPAHGSGFKIRMGVLLTILAVAVAAVGWEFLVAKPGVDAAWAKVQKEEEEVAKKPGVIQTVNTDIHKLIGKTPSDTKTKGNYTIEEFRWQRGMPIWKYSIYVVYLGPEKRLNHAYLNQEPSEQDLTGIIPPVPGMVPGVKPPGGPPPVPGGAPPVDAGSNGRPEMDDSDEDGTPADEPPTGVPAIEEPASENSAPDEPATDDAASKEPPADDASASESP